MVDQLKAMGRLADKLMEELQGANTLTERNRILKGAANSQQADHLQDAVDPERLHEKKESVQDNQRLMDKVHISEKAQALYRVHESNLEGIPERVHERIQNNKGEEPEPTPEASMSVLGNLDPEA